MKDKKYISRWKPEGRLPKPYRMGILDYYYDVIPYFFARNWTKYFRYCFLREHKFYCGRGTMGEAYCRTCGVRL